MLPEYTRKYASLPTNGPLLLPDRKFDGILPGERDFQFDRFLFRFVVTTKWQDIYRRQDTIWKD